jgi:hypothetical protein
MMFSQGDRVIKPFWKNLQQKESQFLVSLYWKIDQIVIIIQTEIEIVKNEMNSAQIKLWLFSM